MPKVAYTEAERKQVKDALISTGLELFAQQGIQHTTVEQIYQRVGISRTFFYSFFPAKEDLVVQTFYRQQPQMLAYAQALMEDPGLSWRDAVEQFLHSICYGKQVRFAIMTVQEQQALSRCLSEENRQEFQKRRLTLVIELLKIFDLSVEPQTAKLLGNLLFSTVILRKAVPDTLPFLFSDAADETADFQIYAIVNYMESLCCKEEDQNEKR